VGAVGLLRLRQRALPALAPLCHQLLDEGGVGRMLRDVDVLLRVGLVVVEFDRVDLGMILAATPPPGPTPGRSSFLPINNHSVTDVQARLVRVVSNEFAGNPAVPTYRALVHGIRIDALDADERRKQ